MCACTVRFDRVVEGVSRTAVPTWIPVMLCPICAKKVREVGEALIYRADEWVTVRLDEPVVP